MTLTYSTYLKIDELLKLQEPLSADPEHDENLFITIHQVYELWFKQVLHELRRARRVLRAGDAVSAQSTLKRVLTIFKTLVGQVDILETMTPLSFSSFRSLLASSSGFQSVQFRELEILLGVRDSEKIAKLPLDDATRAYLAAELQEPSLYDDFITYLSQNGFVIPESASKHDRTQTTIENPELQKVLLDMYRNHPTAAQIAERLVDLDEGIQEWRYRHIKMVERTIGMKMGTGGSPGAAYLKTTIFSPAFPDLWAIRKEF